MSMQAPSAGALENSRRYSWSRFKQELQQLWRNARRLGKPPARASGMVSQAESTGNQGL